MLKSENFTDPMNAIATVNDAFHGHDGPVHVSYPQFVYPSAAMWTPTLATLGLKATDPQGGERWGGYIAPNLINPTDRIRKLRTSIQQLGDLIWSFCLKLRKLQ